MYVFWIETYQGHITRWTRLLKKDALAMHRATQQHTPETVKRFGWEEQT